MRNVDTVTVVEPATGVMTFGILSIVNLDL